jgi:protoporphyrinogen/coproporphyrinogen III oxidase
MSRSAVVVGAGLAGLTAAHRLQRAGWEVDVFEREAKPGGRVETHRIDGYTIDTGATAVGSGYDAYLELAAELGVRLIPSAQSLAIPRQGRLHLLAMDRMVRSGLSTRLLSPAAKLRTLRLAADLIRAKRRGYLDNTDLGRAAAIDNETAATYARRVLGDELCEYLVAPLTRTMMVADPERISKVQMFSGIVNAFGGRWQSPEGGAATMAAALASRLRVRTRCEVERLSEEAGGVSVAWRDADGAPHAQDYAAAVLACPLPVAVRVAPEAYRPPLARLSERLDYTQTITVSLGTTRRPACPALMVLIPPSEDPEIALFFLDHNKSSARAPAGHGLFTLYFEMDAAPRRLDDSDEVLVERAARTLLSSFPELAGTIDFTHVRRWSTALPHVKEGAFAEIGRFVDGLDPAARVQFAGDYMSETGMNTAIALGARAADNLARYRDCETSAEGVGTPDSRRAVT